MDFKSKKEQYRVEIRRKNINQRIMNFRRQIFTEVEGQNVDQVILDIKNIFNSHQVSKVIEKLQLIKQHSQNNSVISQLKHYFQIFYKILLEVDNLKFSQSKRQQIFVDTITILINITSFQWIDFKQKVDDDIATTLIKNIYNPKREINTIWLISNILYRHNNFSTYFIRHLVKSSVDSYIKNRMSSPFQSETDLTIFNYFIGAIIANMGESETFADYRYFIKIAEYISQFESQQCYWYLLQGLVEHAPTFNKFDYQIFSTSVLKKCQDYCRNKKSKFISKYLELVANFLQGQNILIVKSNEQNRKKLISQQYDRCKKYLILKNLEYCLDNRSPQVKKWLFEIAYMLIALYFQQISLVNEYFYLTLAEEIKNIQKFQEKLAIWALRFFKILIISLLKEGICKNQQLSESIVKFVENTLLFQKINYLLIHFDKSTEIISDCFDILAYMQDYQIPELLIALKKVDLLPAIESLACQSPQLIQKKNILIEYLGQNNNIMNEL